MKNVPEFANAVFVNFAKPIVHKVMMDFISKSEFLADDNFAFNYTNQNAFTDLNLFYKILQKLRFSSYHEGDTEIVDTLKDRVSLLGNRERKGFISDGKIHFISNTTPDLNYEDFVNETLRIGYVIFNKYLPGLSFEAIERYCKTNDVKETIDRVSTFCSTAESIVKGMKKYKEKIKEEEDRVGVINKNRWAAYEESRKKAEKTKDWSNVVPFEKELVDYSKIKLDSQFISRLFNTAKYLNKHLPADIKLNSTNAEGNSASDIIKNCYVSRLFEVINSFNEEKQKTINNGYNMSAHEGLIALRDYVNKDGEQGQYANNPIFWGVTNLDGKVIRDGMFNRTGVIIGYNNKIENSNINRDANDIIGYSLFDGSRNPFTDDGNTYASMSKVDFFLTQFIAYERSIMSYNNEKYNPNPGMDSALYSMRIGSDAPKIFFIRAPKYNQEELNYCFLGHLLDEINMFSKGINSLFVNENGTYITRKDIKGLFGRAFFNEDEARIIRQNDDKVKDYTTAIVKDGKLVGNLFSFNRLFKVGNYNAGEEIANVLSLYGRADDSLFVKNGNRLEINQKRIQDGTITIDENSGKLSFNITREIKEKLLDIVKTWEKEYLKDSYIRLRPYEQYLEKIGYASPNMNRFILNTANMNMCYDDLFEGDFKFYKDSRDFLKRTKETQAGGDGYAGYNINNILDDTIVTNQRNGKDETIKVKQQKDTYTEVFEAKDYVTTIWKDGRLQEAPLESRSGFRAITIYNTVKSADEAPDLQRKLEQVFKDKGLSDEKAKEKSVEIAAGYFKPTKTNDAQSYITIEEFIRRRYLDGTLDQYQDLLAQILDPNVAAEDIDISGINARIQVQKNFYYDKIYDANTGLYYARQIKNAEFVLIPKLLPKDSQLRKIYDFMKKNDINQLNTAETSKAANKDIFTIWDEKTGEFNEDFEKNFDNSYIENYSYAYLYNRHKVQEHSVDKTNKAGVQLVKRILDNNNTAVNSDVKKWSDEFVDAYTANIEESFYNVLDKFGWTYDTETKKIINADYRTTDENGEPLPKDIIERNKQEIDFEYFWRRFIEESARLGMDSNYMDYVVPDENGIPKMPTFMNLSNAKLQSIANSIFSRAIARQTLPGWHCVQITGVGYSKKLKFDANTGIMEVYLPRWSKLIPKGKNAEEEAAILKQIQEAGLDIQIGYRIPTEGKQSISVLRVVGFTNECLGSTIVVPDAWVTQTGSDFDVDSIYGICWEMYKTSKNGNVELHKIEYEEGKTDDKQLYIKYVNNKLENKVKKDKFGNEIDDNIKKLKDELNNKDKRRELDADFQKYDKKRNELFNNLHIRVKRTIATENKNMNKKAKKDKVAVDLIELYDRINSKLDKLLDNAEKHKFTELDIANIKEYQDYLTALIDIMKNQDGIPSFDKSVYKSEKAKLIENAVEEAKEKYFNKIKDAAKEAELMSFDEFTKLPHVKKLDTRARNNYILDRSIKIMNDDSTREEQYSRSQFEELSKANKLIDKLYNIDKNSQSPYNILDQLDYFEDVMGGRRLKAISVMWDSFISRNNRIKTKLNPRIAINVWLNEDGKASEYYNHTYDVKEIKNNYTTEEIEFIKKETFDDFVNYSNSEVGVDCNLLDNRFAKTVNNKFSLRAAEFGWSKSNENIDGKLITAYAAQTTAHHLDAVKEGSIQNVNEYTFGVYKLLTAIGLDFTHAIAFIRQPIITESVRYNNIKNSIYSDKSINPIAMTLQSIAARLGINIDDKYAFINNILSKIIDNVKVQKYIRNNYNENIKLDSPKDLIYNDFPIILDRLLDRIANYNNEKSDEKLTEDAVDDLVNLLIFHKLQNIANKINKIINAANIDKEGTKISIYETRVDLDNIEDLRNDDTLVDDYGKTFANKVFNDNSAYKQLNAIYEFVTKQSVDVNSRIFKTESDDFFEYQKNINKLLQHKFNAKEHQELIKYMVGYMYNQIPALINPVSLDENGNIVIDYNVDNSTYNKERSRIFGYGVYGDGGIVIRDVNIPTKEEIEDYKALTPAQKVIFIQNNFSDSGLFGELHVTSSRASDIKKKGINRQFIYYSDGVNHEENYYDMFVNVFSNKNPLIKLAAIDLIKYAFIAETHTFRPGNISRIISNKVLYANREDGGMDLIKDLNKYFNVLLDVCYAQKFTDSFVRSHSNLVKSYNIFNSGMDYDIKNKLNEGRELSQDEKIYYMQKVRNGVLFANVADDLGQLLLKRFDLFNNVDGYLTLISNYGRTLYRIKAANPIYEEYKVKKEETNNTKDNTTENNAEENNNEKEETEKVLIGYQYYILIPLNMLDNNEYSEYSYNIRNNKFADPEVYSSIFENLVKNSANTRMTRQQQLNIQQVKAVEQYAKEDDYNLLLDRDGLTTIANNVESKLQAQAKKLVDGIAEKIDSEGLMYFNNDVYLQYNPGFELRKIMPKIGVTITQDINTKTQGVVTVDITRIDFSNVINPTNEEYKKVNDELEKNVISKYTAPVYKVVKHVNTDNKI